MFEPTLADARDWPLKLTINPFLLVARTGQTQRTRSGVRLSIKMQSTYLHIAALR